MHSQQLLLSYTDAGAPPVAFVGFTTGTLSSSSFSYTPVAGSAIGDFVVAFIRSDSSSQATTVSGWTTELTVGPTIVSGNGVYRKIQYFRLASISAQTLTITASTSGVSATFMVFRNVRVSTPITNSSSGSWTNPGASSPTPLSPAKSGAVAGQTLVYLIGGSNSITLTPVGSSGAMSTATSEMRYRSLAVDGNYSWTGTWAGGTGAGMQHQLVLNPG